MFASVHLFVDKYPTLSSVVMLAYFSFAISKHWVSYKKTRRENDLAWMILLSIMAVIIVIVLMIDLFM